MREDEMTYEEMEALTESVGTVKRGFAPSDIERIKWKTY